VSLTRRRDPRALDVLAVAYASAGRFDDAIATARAALPLADAALAAEVTRRIALFERREAFVDRR
jgi:Flp pilus assembly protein TadD